MNDSQTGTQMRRYFKILGCLFVLICSSAMAQGLKTKNVIVVTLDGLRWSEVFQGADPSILFNNKFVHDGQVRKTFWDSSPIARRKKLMPFFWNEIAVKGQLYGNRKLKNKVNCTNPHLFSYPGYSEMLVGFIDRRIKSNDKIVNPNYTVLEFIRKQPGFENKVAAFATWDAFPYIFRSEKSAIPVLCSESEDTGDQLADDFTFNHAFEFLQCERPRVMFIGFNETDDHSHGGRYDEY